MVLLALDADLPDLLGLDPRAEIEKFVPVDDLGLDEPTLEVGVNASGAFGSTGVGSKRPGSGFLLPGREEGSETEEVIGAANHTKESSFAESESLEHFGAFGRILDRGCLGFELYAHADDFDVVTGVVELGGDSSFHGRDGVEFVLADIGDHQDSSVGEKEMRCENFALVGRESGAVERATFGQRSLGALESLNFGQEIAVELRLTLSLRQTLFDGLEIGESQFDLDHTEMFERVGRSGNVVVDEGTQHQHDGVDLANVGEELVAEALAFARSFDESTDVDHLDRRMDDVLALRHLGQSIEAIIGDLGHSDVRILGGEGIGGSEGATTGEGVVKGALPCVGKADQTETFHEDVEATRRSVHEADSHIALVILLPLLVSVVPLVPVPVDTGFADSGITDTGTSCASYSIEGSLDSMPRVSEIDPMAANLEVSATAYLHEGDLPLAGHRVIAVFEMADGVPPLTPVEAVTDGDGRVSIVLPVGAIGVSFRAESASTGDCPDLAPGDTPVVFVDVPVDLPTDPGGDGEAEPPGALPTTGRALDLALMAGLMLALGVGTVTLGIRPRNLG